MENERDEKSMYMSQMMIYEKKVKSQMDEKEFFTHKVTFNLVTERKQCVDKIREWWGFDWWGKSKKLL